MRRVTLGLSALVLLSASACGGDDPAPEPSEPEIAAPAASADETPPAEEPAAEAAPEPTPEPVPVSDDAPAFAVIYPGGTLSEEGVQADGEAGPGGIVTFTAPADPDAIVAFYRERAEGEGLASVMAMNQGDARAYGAHSTVSGANLSVVATPLEDGGASVQLVWSAGG